MPKYGARRTFCLLTEEDEALQEMSRRHDLDLADVIRKLVRRGLREARRDPAGVLLGIPAHEAPAP